jgi:transposase
MQFAENLPNRRAAEAVRGRIDWKYALELTDPGFDFSVLCEFRARLLEGGAEQLLLDRMLERFGERGWVKARGRQRTDSTHVPAAVRVLGKQSRGWKTAMDSWGRPDIVVRFARKDCRECNSRAFCTRSKTNPAT